LLRAVSTAGLSLLFAVCAALPPAQAVTVDRLTEPEIAALQSVLATLGPVVDAMKQNGTANVMSWDHLYDPLTDEQRAFLDEFRALKGESLGATAHYFGEAPQEHTLVPVPPQYILVNGRPDRLDPQYLPEPVYDAYVKMMDAMEAEIGSRLLVESGYRSPAYQLYLFLFYLPKHDHSIIETNKFVALPGHSEHGYPPRQAIDFINDLGVNGEDDPEAFEALPGFGWLQNRARQFGFHLSYPRNNPTNTAYEPWHWHYEAR
jgi:D-alanyl-D-alanine carboxypeptidase